MCKRCSWNSGRLLYVSLRGNAGFHRMSPQGEGYLFLPAFDTRRTSLNETPPMLPMKVSYSDAIDIVFTSWHFLALPQFGSPLLTLLHSPSSAPGALAQPNSSQDISPRSFECMTLRFPKASHPRSCLWCISSNRCLLGCGRLESTDLSKWQSCSIIKSLAPEKTGRWTIHRCSYKTANMK